MFGVDDPAVRDAIGAYVKLLRANRAVAARLEPRLAACGLTLTQFGVLELLLHKGPLHQREIGRKVLTSPGNVTDVIDKLEARGLVERLRDPADRRMMRVALSGHGRMVIEDLFPRHAADIARTMSGLSRDELGTLAALLRKLGMEAARDVGSEAALASSDHAP
jgi:MarR family 2-MHQ and catechol resistance regulon transcriptional repressor